MERIFNECSSISFPQGCLVRDVLWLVSECWDDHQCNVELRKCFGDAELDDWKCGTQCDPY